MDLKILAADDKISRMLISAIVKEYYSITGSKNRY
jgi:hypothetical protein